MSKGVLIALACLALCTGCGDGSTGAASSPADRQQPFRIPVHGTPPIRREAQVKAKWHGHGLLGPEPRPVMPQGSPPDSLAQQDLIQGIGHLAAEGSTVVVQYVGISYPTGRKLESSWEKGRPFTFRLGSGEVMKGWEEGVEGMEVGDRRELVVPPQLTGEGPPRQTGIAGSTLIYVIDLLDVE